MDQGLATHEERQRQELGMEMLLRLLTECAHACQGMGKGREVAKWPCAFEATVMRYGVQVLATHSGRRHVLEGDYCEGGGGRLVWRGCRNYGKWLLNGPGGICADLLEPL